MSTGITDFELDLDLLMKDGEGGITSFDAADYLNGPEDIAAYLTLILKRGDDSMLAAALGNLARAAGMAKVAEHTGIRREALYKALRQGAVPRLSTVNRVVRALGMRMVIVKDTAMVANSRVIAHGYAFNDTVTPASANFHLEAVN